MIAKRIDSPVGELTLVAYNHHLIAVLWDQEKDQRVPLDPFQYVLNDFLLNQAASQLKEYFSGKRAKFDIPLLPRGTPFQQAVWKELRQIPYGKTCSYLDIAKKIGKPHGARAVGTTIGKNPLSIIIPCHRVIGSSGSLTGFAGGLERKQLLLQLEKGSPLSY